MKDYMRFAMLACVAAAGLVSVSGARAFNNVVMFSDDPSQGPHAGGGDIWGTGSVRDWGVQCNHCHINDKNQQGQITSQFTTNPPLSGGKYVPGTQYTVTVKLLGEHLGTSDPTNNRNGFVATFENMNGQPTGGLLGDMQTSCPATPTMPDALLPGGTFAYSYNNSGCVNVASLFKSPAPTQWTFKWTAPAAGTGTVIMYYGLVDGDASQSSYGDDVKMGKQMLPEGP
jgi:hypothetical protein